jgi:inorganic triphosphatase YgiF
MEIERKFVVPENFRQLLEDNGFNFVKEFEEVLHDKYFDTQGPMI